MVDHIYGRSNVISRTDRPNMFIKELSLYIDFIKKKIENTSALATTKDKENLFHFIANLKDGINYYEDLFLEIKDKFQIHKNALFTALESGRKDLNLLHSKI